MKFFATLLVLALVAAALVAFAIYAPVRPPAGTSPDNSTYVDIAPGTGTQAIATQLEHAGVLRTRFAFDLLRLAKGGRLLAGEYRFDHRPRPPRSTPASSAATSTPSPSLSPRASTSSTSRRP